jgi:hypothetical protein
MNIRTLGAALALGLSLVAAPALAADNPQQNKMAACNKSAGDKKGDERKAYMSQCLSAKKEMTQQDKMKACNASAADKKGDERKAHMKECLSKKG